VRVNVRITFRKRNEEATFSEKLHRITECSTLMAVDVASRECTLSLTVASIGVFFQRLAAQHDGPARQCGGPLSLAAGRESFSSNPNTANIDSAPPYLAALERACD
jgi:hypothetical protein